MNSVITRNILSAEEFIKKADLAGLCNFQNSSRDNDVKFFNIEISDFAVENKSIRRSDFSFSKISNVRFEGIDFEGSEFNHTELTNIIFSRCKLRRSGFDFSNMKNVIFEDCWLDTSSFDYASGDITYIRSKVHGMELHHTLAEVTFQECAGEAMQASYSPNLKISARNCDFHRAEFVDSVFLGEMENCIFTDADFYGSDCTRLRFKDCKMRELNVSGSVGLDIEDDSCKLLNKRVFR